MQFFQNQIEQEDLMIGAEADFPGLCFAYCRVKAMRFLHSIKIFMKQLI
jgi:hypothetical protein